MAFPEQWALIGDLMMELNKALEIPQHGTHIQALSAASSNSYDLYSVLTL